MQEKFEDFWRIFFMDQVCFYIYSFLWASVGGKSQAEEAKFLFDMCESLIGILSITAIKAMKQALLLKLNDEEENGKAYNISISIQVENAVFECVSCIEFLCVGCTRAPWKESGNTPRLELCPYKHLALDIIASILWPFAAFAHMHA